mgnify:CR=1 FL=1
MKPTVRIVLMLIALLLTGALVAQAQDAPPQINNALADLSTRLGRTIRLQDLDTWQFAENRYTDTALGCALVTGEPRPEGISAYTFTLTYQGVTYDYRVALDSTIVRACDAALLQVTLAAPVVAEVDACPQDFAGFLAPRLSSNGQAQLVAGGTPSRLRAAPSVQAEQIGLINPSVVFAVTSGPSCGADGFVWWQVSVNGQIGWVAEGALPDAYFLEPAGIALTITPIAVTLLPATPLATAIPETPLPPASDTPQPTAFPLGTPEVLAADDLPELAGVTGGALTALHVREAGLQQQIALAPMPIAVAPGIDHIEWSPDGRSIAYTTINEDSTLNLYVTTLDGGEPVLLAENLFYTMPVDFTLDGTQVVYAKVAVDALTQEGQVLDFFAQGLTAGSTANLIASANFGVGCGGGSPFPGDTVYNWEAGYGGRPLALEVTAAGIVYSTNCTGSGTALLNLQTGESTVLGERLSRVDVSMDGAQLVGITDPESGAPTGGTLTVVDLATGNQMPLAAVASPDQVAWGATGEIFYSTRTTVDGTIPGSDAEFFETTMGMTGGVSLTQVTIHRVDLAATTDAEVYTGNAYAVGRLMASPDGQWLFFSTIPNAEALADAVTGGAVTAQTSPEEILSFFLPNLNRLALATGAAEEIAPDVLKSTLNRAAYPPSASVESNG